MFKVLAHERIKFEEPELIFSLFRSKSSQHTLTHTHPHPHPLSLTHPHPLPLSLTHPHTLPLTHLDRQVYSVPTKIIDKKMHASFNFTQVGERERERERDTERGREIWREGE